MTSLTGSAFRDPGWVLPEVVVAGMERDPRLLQHVSQGARLLGSMRGVENGRLVRLVVGLHCRALQEL